MTTLKQECENIYKELLAGRLHNTTSSVDFSKKNWRSMFVKFISDTKSWSYISKYQKLSESFILKYFYALDKYYISKYQKLSESFIEKHADRVDLDCISEYQKLSESFILKYFDALNKYFISKYQKLSESFILKYFDDLDKHYISKYQKLSESFILKYFDDLDKHYISKYQKLSESFRKDKGIIVPDTCWLYKDVNFFRNYIKENTYYTIETDNKGDYIIAYKGIRSDRYSNYNFSYRYLKGKTYSSHCDCNVDEEDSFGLSAWTEESAKEYCSELVVRVKIYLKNIGCFVHNASKIRCRELTILD